MRFSVVIPMYNEKAAAPSCIRQLAEALEESAEASSFSYELIFSDDGSDDGCGALIRDFAEHTELRHGSVMLLREERNRGKGAAVRRGMLAAAGDVILFTDCDLAYGCPILTEMLADFRERGGDLLVGSRALSPDGYAGYSGIRTLASRLCRSLLRAVSGFRYTDSQCGIKLFAREAARELFSRTETDGWAFDFEVLLLADRMGYTVREFPVRVLNHRSSKIRLLRDSVRMLREVWRIRRRIARQARLFPD